MRIVYLNPVAELGGGERCLLTILQAVRHLEPAYDLHLITGAEGPLLDQARQLGVQASALPFPKALATLGDSVLTESGRLGRAWSLAARGCRALPEVWVYLQALNRRLCHLQPDLVHSNGMKTHLLSGLAAHHQAKLIWHMHDYLDRRPLMKNLLRCVRRRVTGVVAVSASVGRVAQAQLRGMRVHVVPNAVDLERFSRRSEDGGWLDHEAGLPSAASATVRVGLVATYARWKGHEVFLCAAAELLRRNPGVPVRFYCVGGPIYQTVGSQFTVAELRQLARQLGLGDNIGFVGFQAEPARVYQSLDVVVHASTQPEPFGLTIVEAMACGKPVLVSAGGGAAEIVAGLPDAVAIPPGDTAAMAVALERLVSDPDLRLRSGQAGQSRAEARFSHLRLGRDLVQLYQSRKW